MVVEAIAEVSCTQEAGAGFKLGAQAMVRHGGFAAGAGMNLVAITAQIASCI
jgi:hypothetical protein